MADETSCCRSQRILNAGAKRAKANGMVNIVTGGSVSRRQKEKYEKKWNERQSGEKSEKVEIQKMTG